MTRKADFNAEEWSAVVEAPVYAAMRVITADRGGTLRESLALGRVYQEARAGHGESALLDELVKSPLTVGRMYPGDHTLAVRARDRFGNVDATPAKASWKVVRVAAGR